MDADWGFSDSGVEFLDRDPEQDDGPCQAIFRRSNGCRVFVIIDGADADRIELRVNRVELQ